MTIKNLWGEIDTLPKVKAPVAILNEQSRLLEKMTNGLLIGRVSQRAYQKNPHTEPEKIKENFILDFFINAPSLNNYSYHVLTIEHNIGLYPVSILQGEDTYGNQHWKNCDNVEEFESELEEIFSSTEIRNVITGLLAQIQST